MSNYQGKYVQSTKVEKEVCILFSVGIWGAIADVLEAIAYLQMSLGVIPAFCEILKGTETKGQPSVGEFLSVHTRAIHTCSLCT